MLGQQVWAHLEFPFFFTNPDALQFGAQAYLLGVLMMAISPQGWGIPACLLDLLDFVPFLLLLLSKACFKMELTHWC